MKKIITLILAIVLVVGVALSACIVFGIIPVGSSDKAPLKSDTVRADDEKVSIVTAPEQESVVTPAAFTEDPNTTVPEMPEGDNLAKGCKAISNCYADVYYAKFITDGITKGGSYWEGNFQEQAVNSIYVDLGEKKSFNTVCLKLNENRIWSKRKQTFTIQGGNDGVNWTDIVAEAEYKFDPSTGNFVVVDFDSVEYQYVQLLFTANTGAGGGQIAELEIFSL